jgi:hypothetical protein
MRANVEAVAGRGAARGALTVGGGIQRDEEKEAAHVAGAVRPVRGARRRLGGGARGHD